MVPETVAFRLIGFVLSLILTLAAFFIVIRPDFFHLAVRDAIFVLLTLAVIQFIVQAMFFLSLWREKGPRWNLVVFVSTIFIIITVVVGSIWIMNHLNYNMMLQ